jgi:transposase InsO family protein
MIFRFVSNHQAEFPIFLMCRVLAVSRSGYYAWLKHPESKKDQDDKALSQEIYVIHQESFGTYGSPRVYRELKRRGKHLGENRVARLMRKDGLRAKTKRKFKATTDSRHHFPVATNLLNREFTPEEPNQAWASDITYIWTAEGWLYLAVVMDLFSRSIVGWSMSERMTRALVIDAFVMAVKRRNPLPGLLHHSDQGSQYASADYQAILAKYGAICSMSHKGNCWDNAPVESFFSTLKKEHIFHNHYGHRTQARQSIFVYIEQFYNRKRIHSAIGYRTPSEMEQFKLAA